MAKISYDKNEAQRLTVRTAKLKAFKHDLESIPDVPGYSVLFKTYEEFEVIHDVNKSREFNIKSEPDENNEFTRYEDSNGKYIIRDGEKVYFCKSQQKEKKSLFEFIFDL
jgi:hypothetical protein